LPRACVFSSSHASATTQFYTLSLHDALPISMATAGRTVAFSSLTVIAALASLLVFPQRFLYSMGIGGMIVAFVAATLALVALPRSEEHTSELQSRVDLVCRLLLEKKKI